MKAKDAGGHPGAAEANVLVTVLDENDNAPSIVFDTKEKDFVDVIEGMMNYCLSPHLNMASKISPIEKFSIKPTICNM